MKHFTRIHRFLLRRPSLHGPSCFIVSSFSRFIFALLALAVLSAFSPSLRAARIKDLTLVEGGRDNQLIGYGLVAGLAGDGDSTSQATLQSVANALQRFGLAVP